MWECFDQGNVIFGGDYDGADCFMALTLMDQIEQGSELDQEEIFGPILPIYSFERFDDAFKVIADHPAPLAVYLFSENVEEKNRFKDKLSFGGGCINDCIVFYLSNANLPFGGITLEAYGSYHGKHSFNTFSHLKAIYHATTIFDNPVRYLPNSSWKENL